jgi:hypothetical protein
MSGSSDCTSRVQILVPGPGRKLHPCEDPARYNGYIWKNLVRKEVQTSFSTVDETVELCRDWSAPNTSKVDIAKEASKTRKVGISYSSRRRFKV